MPPENSLSELQEALLFAIWKLRGIGDNPVTDEQLRVETTNHPAEALPSDLGQLESQGFIDVIDKGGRKGFSITPLGVAILRKIEEDRLQEIK